MSTLARLRGETERLRTGRRVFVSSEPVQAYKVANNKKQLLEGDHPFVLALPEDDRSSSTSLSLLDASVGPDLHWTLSSINHVLRTVSKYGKPTYLFAGIVDTDPQAFVAVTLNKRTPREELDQLQDVIGRVSQFHVADSKPVQVPGPEQVIGALGKGLAKMVFGGGSKHKDKDQDKQRHSPSSTSQQQQQQSDYSWLSPSEREAAERARTDKERQDYLASLDQRRGAHVAGATPTSSYDAYGRGRYEEEGEDVPTAPKMPSSGPMGVHGKAEAEARLAALKAEMGGGQGGAPGLSRDRHEAQRPSAYPSIPTDNTRTRPADWQAHTPGTLSNPFTPGHTADKPLSYEDYLGRDEQWGGNRHAPAHHAPAAYSGDTTAGVTYTQSGDPVAAARARQQQQELDSLHTDAGWGGSADRGSGYGGYKGSDSAGRDTGYGTGYRGYGEDRTSSERGGHPTGGVSEREQRRLKYEQEAREAREEWERAQRDAARRAAEADSAPAGPNKSRVRYHEVKYDTTPYGGEERGGQGQPAYAYAGGRGGEEGQRDQARKQKQQAPDWLEVLGKVFAGGPSYQTAGADL